MRDSASSSFTHLGAVRDVLLALGRRAVADRRPALVAKARDLGVAALGEALFARAMRRCSSWSATRGPLVFARSSSVCSCAVKSVSTATRSLIAASSSRQTSSTAGGWLSPPSCVRRDASASRRASSSARSRCTPARNVAIHAVSPGAPGSSKRTSMPNPSGWISAKRHWSCAAPGSTRSRHPIGGGGPALRNTTNASPTSMPSSVRSSNARANARIPP